MADECSHNWKFVEVIGRYREARPNDRVLLWVCESCQSSKTTPLIVTYEDC